MSVAYNGTYHLSSVFEPESALTNIEQNRISVLFTVPTCYFALLSAGGYRPERLASVDHLLWGGAAIKPDLVRSLHRDLDAKHQPHIRHDGNHVLALQSRPAR
jgi:acyl-coenzyme A synthetase/AMP-(fatty) acid ligase